MHEREIDKLLVMIKICDYFIYDTNDNFFQDINDFTGKLIHIFLKKYLPHFSYDLISKHFRRLNILYTDIYCDLKL